MARLCEFQGPQGWADNKNIDMAQRYAFRDAVLYPNMTLECWRELIESNIKSNQPFNKMYVPHEIRDQMMAWQNRLNIIPKNAPPYDVYMAAPVDVFDYIGW